MSPKTIDISENKFGRLIPKNTEIAIVRFINANGHGESKMFQTYNDEGSAIFTMYLRRLPNWSFINEPSIVIASIGFSNEYQSKGFFSKLLFTIEQNSPVNVVGVESVYESDGGKAILPSILIHKGFQKVIQEPGHWCKNWFKKIKGTQND